MLVRIALLLHELPDGSSHVDLLVARDGAPSPDDARVVPTWRVATRPDHAPAGSTLSLERIGDHRGVYLHLTQPRALSGDRGVVTPLRRGEAVRDGARFALRWEDGGVGHWRLEESEGRSTLRIEPVGADVESDHGQSRTTGEAERADLIRARAHPP